MNAKSRKKPPRCKLRLTAGGVTVAFLAAACAGGTQTAAPPEGGESAEAVQLERPVTMIAAFGPGGGSDQVARAAASAMEEPLGVDVPVVNVPGATGNVGMNKLVTDRPGESMAILIQDTLATIPLGTSQFQLDQVKAVCRLQKMPSALFIKKGTYDGSWEELATAAKEKPNQVKVATVGRGGVDDLMLSALGEAQGTKFRKVPFSEPSERYAALLGGSVDAVYDQLGDVRQYLDSGDFVPVAIFSDGPVEGYEDVPNATDLGVPQESVLSQFRGIIVHADTQEGVVRTLNKACAEVMENPKFQKFQEQVFSTEDSYMGADEFDTYIEEQERAIRNLMQKYGVIE